MQCDSGSSKVRRIDKGGYPDTGVIERETDYDVSPDWITGSRGRERRDVSTGRIFEVYILKDGFVKSSCSRCQEEEIVTVHVNL